VGWDELANPNTLNWDNLFSSIGIISMILNAVIEKDEFGYFAQIPELKGCVTQGNTYEEVLLNIQEAAELYLESLKTEELHALQKRKVIISPIEVAVHA
jgi:predicted RNase H-like HicB family nuclease